MCMDLFWSEENQVVIDVNITGLRRYEHVFSYYYVFTIAYLQICCEVERCWDEQGDDEAGDGHEDGHVGGYLALMRMDQEPVPVHRNQQDGEGGEEDECCLKAPQYFANETLNHSHMYKYSTMVARTFYKKY